MSVRTAKLISDDADTQQISGQRPLRLSPCRDLRQWLPPQAYFPAREHGGTAQTIPTSMFAVSLLVCAVVLLCFVEEFRKSRHVVISARFLPFAAGQPLGDFLQEPLIAVRILE